jgi:hypothetical protein
MGSAAPYQLVFDARAELRHAARVFEAVAVGADFEPYESSSLFLVVTDASGEIVGAARVILPSPNAGVSWELASFAVRPGRDHDLVAAALCHGLLQALRVYRVRVLVAKLDDTTRETLSRFGLQLNSQWTRVSTLLDLQKTANPEAYRLITQGIGLDGVAVTAFRAGVPGAAVERELAPSA